jgi:hypothetical protein
MSLFGGGGQQVIEQPQPVRDPAPPQRGDKAAQAAAKQERKRRRQAKGRSSTILTDTNIDTDTPKRGAKRKRKLGGS